MMTTQQGPHQSPAHQLSINTNIASTHTSPESSQGTISLGNDGRRASQSSPINLASNLNSLSLDSQQQQHEQPLYTIKVKNAPSDITVREAYCIFAFAKDFTGLELIPDSNNMPVIYARFRSLSAASTYSQILETSQVFGPSYPFLLKAEILDNAFQQPLSLGTSSKRPSIGAQRSRFLFSDPFSNEPIAENLEQAPAIAGSNGVGKTLLLMESQQEARDYDQFVRDPWAQPQSARPPPTTASSFSGPSSGSYVPPQPQTSGVEWDRRRQNSTFFSSQSPLMSGQLGSAQIPTQLSLNQSVPPMSSSTQQMNPPPQSQPLGTQTPMNQSINISSAAQIQGSLSNQPPQAPISSVPAPMVPPSQGSVGSSTQSSQVDLSILARVPPPANPADQNPPCNTLYVGNLPPDATEAELRQLFSPQRGFRRLSFRTKQVNGSAPGTPSHSHGPMCFVEFEDVGLATRALAELYGRTLPRPGGAPGKGGIRLSFSKNPLGVRGPGQRRTSGFSYQSGFKS